NCTKCKSYYTKYVDYVFGCMSESMSKELAEKHFYDNEPDCPCFDLLESSKENKTSSDLSVVLRQEFNINEDN
ncbi:MAG: hypothetical protein N3E37_05260, partial [Candidatus Micrarchaeota archaeon]|nr:hypothetical protein [Candidatus Micrarchaeota archaeon]